MNGPLSVATIVVALVLAAWFLLRSALNRPPSRFDLLATALLGLLVAVLVVVAVVGLFDGERPVETATFIGYLFTTIAFAPTAFVITLRSGWRSISSEVRIPSAQAADTHESSRVSWVSLPSRSR